MRDRVKAKRYSKAIVELAIERGCVDRIDEGRVHLIEAIAAVPALIGGLADERASFPERMSAAREIGASLQLDSIWVNALCLLIEKNCVYLIPRVLEDVADRVRTIRHLARARAWVFDGDAVHALRKQLGTILCDLLGCEVTLDVIVDPSILGGFVMAIGDTQFDASLKGGLDRMKEQMLA